VEAGPSNTLCAKFALRKFLQSRYTTIGALNTAWGLTASTMPRAFTTFDSSQTVYSDVLVATSDGSTATYMFTLPNVSVASELTKNSLRLYVNGKVLGFDYCHQLTGPANKCNAATGSPNFGIGVNTGPIYGSNLLGYPTRANNHATMSKVNYLTGAVTLVLSWPYPAGTEIRADYTTGGFGTPQGTGLLDTWNMATLSGASSTLSAAVTSTSALTITVTDGSVFGTTVGVIRIDGEYMNVCSKSGNTMTICSGGRGYIGSVAATHSSGATVDQLGIAHTLIGYGCANSASSCAWKTDLDDFLYWHMRQYFLNVRQVLWEQDLSTSTGPGAGLTGAAARAYCATKGNCLMYFGTTYLSGWGGTPARDKVLQAARGIVDIFPGNSTPLDSPISERDNNMLRHIYAHMGDVPIVTWESFRANEAPAGFRGTSCGANRTATISNAVVNEGLATITMPHGSGAGAPGMWFKITGNTILNGTYQMNTSQAIDSFTFWTTAPAGSYPGGTVQIYRMMDSSKDGHSRLNLTTQAERGAAVKSWMQSALDMSYPNGSRPYVGYRWWEWHDNYGECSNWGLVNLNDDLFDGSSGRATGFDDSGKPTGGWPLGGYTDFNSRFKEANALWLNSIYRTVKQMRGNVILGGDVR
jgi:hypothetical protein